jgi:hypothetical protein
MSPTPRRRSVRNVSLAFGLLLPLMALVLAQTALAGGPTWGVIHHVTDGVRLAPGAALATTLSSSNRYLHATYRRDAGKVQFKRSSNGGTTWTSFVTLNDSAMVYGEPRVAASGNDVWVAWARRYTDPDTEQQGKAIVVRHNGAHGSASGWDRSIVLTSRTGDVRAPSISVTDGGNSIYVTFSDLRNDTTRLMYSHDGGRIWVSTIVGEGYDMDGEDVPTTIPQVAASGNNVVVAWLAAGNVATARVSTDGGDHWSDPAEIGQGLASAAALGGRLAIAGTKEGGIAWTRIWETGDWGLEREVPQITLGGNTASAVEVDVVLQSSDRVGVVYSAQVDVDEETADTWEEVTWFTSANDGATWSSALRVSRAGSEDEALNADAPTAVWLSTGKLWVAWRQEKVVDPGHHVYAIRQRS